MATPVHLHIVCGGFCTLSIATETVQPQNLKYLSGLLEEMFANP